MGQGNLGSQEGSAMSQEVNFLSDKPDPAAIGTAGWGADRKTKVSQRKK